VRLPLLPFLWLALLLALPLGAAKAETHDSPHHVETEAVLQALKQAAADVRTVQSDFVQEKRLKAFSRGMRSEGRMYLEKPDKLRWEYLSPGKSGFAVNGGSARRWSEFEPESEPFALEDDPLAKAVSQQLLAWAGVDLERLGTRFAMVAEQAEPPVLRLTARDERLGDYLRELRIHFAPDLRSVTRVELHEPGGDATVLEFMNTRLNEPLPEGIFE
jgi:outer membrane lipoprotein carrier protein